MLCLGGYKRKQRRYYLLAYLILKEIKEFRYNYLYIYRNLVDLTTTRRNASYFGVFYTIFSKGRELLTLT